MSFGKIEELVVGREFVLWEWIGLGKLMLRDLEKLANAAGFADVPRNPNYQEPSGQLCYQCRPLPIAELEKMASTFSVVLQKQ